MNQDNIIILVLLVGLTFLIITTYLNQPLRDYQKQKGESVTKSNRSNRKQPGEPDTILTPNLNVSLRKPHRYHRMNKTDIRYSQVGQDIAVYNMFQKKNGFFIELGAFNGKLLSNTLWLERHHNWTGLLIEANPDLCKAIDTVKRRAWRLCGCISDKSSSIFIKGGAVGGTRDTVDKHHMKLLNLKATVEVPCFRLQHVLDKINQSHIDYFSLDVEGAELFILNSLERELKSRKIIVDVWTIEYRVWDGTRIIVDKSKQNLQNLRKFFTDVGGYTEHSQMSYSKTKSDGHALDVVFVNSKTWCDKYQKLPNGSDC